MARQTTTEGGRAAGGGGWASVPLQYAAPPEPESLCLDGKCEGGDPHLGHVRDGRFADSFMMASNGGSSHETMLRVWQSRQVADAPPRDPARTVPRRPGLHSVIGGSDERIEIRDTSLTPARSVGLLRIGTRSGPPLWGTAWLIGPRTLATAAHNVIDPASGPVRTLDVAMAYDGRNARGGWHRIVDNRVPVPWQEDPGPANPFDFAVLRIEDATVGNKLGWFGFSDYEDAKFADLAVNLYGYSLDEQPQFAMYGSVGRVREVDDRRIHHDCDSAGGMSGGPLMAKFGDHRIAVGIHVGGDASENFATRITAEAFSLFNEFRAW